MLLPVIELEGISSLAVSTLLERTQQRGIRLTGVLSHQFTVNEADSLLSVYQHVVENYGEMLLQYASGKSLIFEFHHEDQPVVPMMREIVGPKMIGYAIKLRPDSLRGKFVFKNKSNDAFIEAFHCTDLETDGILEAKYVFEDLGSN